MLQKQGQIYSIKGSINCMLQKRSNICYKENSELRIIYLTLYIHNFVTVIQYKIILYNL